MSATSEEPQVKVENIATACVMPGTFSGASSNLCMANSELFGGNSHHTRVCPAFMPCVNADFPNGFRPSPTYMPGLNCPNAFARHERESVYVDKRRSPWEDIMERNPVLGDTLEKRDWGKYTLVIPHFNCPCGRCKLQSDKWGNSYPNFKALLTHIETYLPTWRIPDHIFLQCFIAEEGAENHNSPYYDLMRKKLWRQRLDADSTLWQKQIEQGHFSFYPQNYEDWKPIYDLFCKQFLRPWCRHVWAWAVINCKILRLHKISGERPYASGHLSTCSQLVQQAREWEQVLEAEDTVDGSPFKDFKAELGVAMMIEMPNHHFCTRCRVKEHVARLSKFRNKE